MDGKEMGQELRSPSKGAGEGAGGRGKAAVQVWRAAAEGSHTDLNGSLHDFRLRVARYWASRSFITKFTLFVMIMAGAALVKWYSVGLIGMCTSGLFYFPVAPVYLSCEERVFEMRKMC
jgi:hypothetical protein